MTTPTLTSDPRTFRAITAGIARRARTAPRLPLLQRLFPSLVPRKRRERVTRISPTEIVDTNPAYLA